MKKNIIIAAMSGINGLVITAGAVELNAVRAGDIPGMAVTETVAVPAATRSVCAMLESGSMKLAVSGTSEFYGNGYSRWEAESRRKALEELEMYTAALKKAGISVLGAEVNELEGYLYARVVYKGDQVLFRSSGTALTVTGARAKMNREAADLRARGAAIIKLEAWRGHDEWGSGGAYAIEYLLAGATRGGLSGR